MKCKETARMMKSRTGKIYNSSCWHFFSDQCLSSISMYLFKSPYMVKSMIVCFYTMLFMRKFTVYGELACFSTKKILSL